MRIATYNINNIVTRLPALTAWLQAEAPDVVCLQELKADQAAFPLAALQALGYDAVWKGQRTWNGVAILARGMTPVTTRTALPGEPDKSQARYIEAAVGGVLVGCLYLPNGNPAPGPKFDYKLAWFEAFLAHAQSLLNAGVPVVLAGDYNVVPTEADLYANHSFGANALLRPETRAAFQRLLDQGWTDSLRAVHPNGPLWTFWSYMRFRWPKDKGLRIDHLLVSPELAGQLTNAGVDRWVRGLEAASDHAPAWIDVER
ncbi:exodeoxyribonuclease III [Caulobacter sp.]|uniref:exodeoxyribonuclease III n=1 Tax=Caulobacter sp. TaxID=78 RepID=UPI0031D078A3